MQLSISILKEREIIDLKNTYLIYIINGYVAILGALKGLKFALFIGVHLFDLSMKSSKRF